jgi:alpha-beta hydrolase superfamily lysophospholipase
MYTDCANVTVIESPALPRLPQLPWSPVAVTNPASPVIENIHYCLWSSQTTNNTDPLAVTQLVLLVHGLGGKPQWMGNLATHLLDENEGLPTSNNTVVYALQMPEYGGDTTTGLGIIPKHAQLPHRLNEAYQHLAQKHPNATITVAGLSLGGLVVSHWAAQYATPNQAIALISPAFKASAVSFNPLFYLNVVWRYGLEKLGLSPSTSLVLPYDDPSPPETRDPSKAPDYVQRLTVASYWQLLKMTLFATPPVLAQLAKKGLPICLAVAPNDIICDAPTMIKAYRQWNNSANRLLVFPNSVHDLLQDEQMPALAKSLMHWMTSR